MRLSLPNITASVVTIMGMAVIFLPSISGGLTNELLAFAAAIVGSASTYLFIQRKNPDESGN